MIAATHDRDAAARLRQEVERAYTRPEARVRNQTQLSVAADIARPTLDNWFKFGIQPQADGMRRIADVLGVEYGRLWSAWLGLPLPQDALERIAQALERAYPKDYVPDPPDVSDLTERLDASQSARRRPAPRGSAGG